MAAFRQPAGTQATSPGGAGTPSLPPGHREWVDFDPRLIDSLLHDHAGLRQLFGQVGAAARTGSAHEIHALLLDFKSRFEAHILTENLRFYDAVEQTVADQPDVAMMVHAFRHEMEEIAHAVVHFVKKYRSRTFTADDRYEYAMDYAVVNRLLEHRLATEEDSLYRLYRPR